MAESAKRTTPTWVPLVPPPSWNESAISRANCFTWSIHARIEPEQSMTSTSSSEASQAGASGGAGGAGGGQKAQPHASGQRYRMILPYVEWVQYGLSCSQDAGWPPIAKPVTPTLQNCRDVHAPHVSGHVLATVHCKSCS